MKWLIVAVAVLGAGWFAYRHVTEQRAIEALIVSVCAQEITDGVMENFKASKEAMATGSGPLTGAALAFSRKKLYERSTLKPHLPALNRAGEPAVARIKELASIASARCPDVFPEPIKAEKPLGFVWMMAIGIDDLKL